MLTDNMKLLVVLALVSMAVCLGAAVSLGVPLSGGGEGVGTEGVETEGVESEGVPPEPPQCLFRAALTTEVSTGKLRLLPDFYRDEMTPEEIVDKREYLFVYNCLEMYAFSYLIIYLLL